MNAGKRRIAAPWLALGVMTLVAAIDRDARAQTPAVDPAAVQALKRMADFVDGVPQFTVRAQNIIEDLHASGHRVDRDVLGTVTVKRPDKMRFERTGGLNQQFFYDGKTITLFNPTENVFATKAAPETIEKMIDLARESVGIVLPGADLAYRNSFPLLTKNLTLGVVVGKAVVGGVVCDQLLFSRPGLDFQVWVSEGAEPWPRKYVVTETAAPVQLSVTTFFSDWKAAAAVDDAQFTFTPPAGAAAISFMPIEATGGSGR